METKPTYEELEQKVKELEKESVERKLAEEEPAESERKFRELAENLSELVYRADPKTLMATYINKAVESFYGYTVNKWLEDPSLWESSIHPDDKEKVLAELSETQHMMENKIIEYRIIKKDNTIRWVEDHVSWEKDQTGTVVSMNGVMYDTTHRKQAEIEIRKAYDELEQKVEERTLELTKANEELKREIGERKRGEEALRESEETFKAIFNNAGVGIILSDKDMNLIMVNDRFSQMLAMSKDELLKSSIKEFTPPENINSIQKRLKSFFQKEIDSYRIERNLIRNDGSIIWVDLSVSPILDADGNIVGSIGVNVDITERKNLEEQLRQTQKMEGIGTLAGGIAHDFNNILSPILMHSEMIMEDLPSGDPLKHDVKEIYKAGKRARDLIQPILTFARKRLEERIVLKSSHIVKEVVKFLRSTIPTTIDIQFDKKAEHDTVLADPTQLNQIVMNLCTNAAHAMREKGGLLEVILDNEDISVDKAKRFIHLKPGQYIKLSVKDNGTGIAPDIRDKIFEPYFTTKGVGEGTGFGLATVYSIVRNYGGDIIVESEVGKGSTFNVYLPLEKTEAQDLKEDSIEIPKGNEHILFVDDEESIVNIMQKSLEKLGYKVTGRTSSVEALEAFRNNPNKFDLVITDMTMPNMTGEDLAKELMNIEPDIPIILCTGFSEKINEEKAKEIGISSFVMKPIIVSEIATTIRNVLDQKE
ncbi:PAS domain S-box protein [Thermodesulfobacteriota bacterium]